MTWRPARPQFSGAKLDVATALLFRSRMTKGYADPFGQLVSDVNVTKIKNLAHLVELVRSSSDEYPTFRFAEDYAETASVSRHSRNFGARADGA